MVRGSLCFRWLLLSAAVVILAQSVPTSSRSGHHWATSWQKKQKYQPQETQLSDTENEAAMARVSIRIRTRRLTFSWWGCYGFCLWRKPTELARSFLFCFCVCFCLYGPFDCISFHEFSQQLSVLSFCSSSLISASLVLSSIRLFLKVSFSPDVIRSGWLGSKHQFN